MRFFYTCACQPIYPVAYLPRLSDLVVFISVVVPDLVMFVRLL